MPATTTVTVELTAQEIDLLQRALVHAHDRFDSRGFTTAADQVSAVIERFAEARRELSERENAERAASAADLYSDETLGAMTEDVTLTAGRRRQAEILLTVPQSARADVSADARHAVNMGAASRRSDGLAYGVLAYRRAVLEFGTDAVEYVGLGRWAPVHEHSGSVTP